MKLKPLLWCKLSLTKRCVWLFVGYGLFILFLFVNLDLSVINLPTYHAHIQLYVSGCIEVLKYVHTPWSEAVEELVQHCLRVDHPHVAMLEKQYQLLQLKKLLNGYGIKNVNFSDTTSSYRWVRSNLEFNIPLFLCRAYY